MFYRKIAKVVAGAAVAGLALGCTTPAQTETPAVQESTEAATLANYELQDAAGQHKRPVWAGKGQATEEQKAAMKARFDALTDAQKAELKAKRPGPGMLHKGPQLTDEQKAAMKAKFDAMTDEEKAAAKTKFAGKKPARRPKQP